MDQEHEEAPPLPCPYCDGKSCPMCPEHVKDSDFPPPPED